MAPVRLVLPFAGPGGLGLALVGGRGRLGAPAWENARTVLGCLGLRAGQGAAEIVVIDAGEWGRAWQAALAGAPDGPKAWGLVAHLFPLIDACAWQCLTADGCALLDVPLAGAHVVLDRRYAHSCAPVRQAELALAAQAAGAAIVALYGDAPHRDLVELGWESVDLGADRHLTLTRAPAERPALQLGLGL